VAPSLSELLERIRPAGAPGAPAKGGPGGRDEGRDRELADLVAVLAAFDEEAAAVVAEARRRADERRAEAALEAGAIRAGLADRLARAAVEPVDLGTGDGPSVAGIGLSARRQIERLRRSADAETPRLVREIVTHILETAFGEDVDHAGRGPA